MRRCWLLTGAMIAMTGLALASCVPSEPVAPPPPAPAPDPAPAPAPVVVDTIPEDWSSPAVAEGNWSYRNEGGVSRALFGAADGEVLFTVACEAARRQVKLWRPTGAATATMMTIATTSARRSLVANPAGTEPPQAVATLAPYDPLLDAMVFSRGRIAVGVPDVPVLYLPNWPEIARVVEDCR